MKITKAKIYFGHDIIHNSGQDIDISFSASGHYFIPISCTNKKNLKNDKINSIKYL